MEKCVDLHTHSTASDGTDSPAELIKKSKDMDLAAIALTDHDTVAGLPEAEEAARDLGQTFIRGCEVSTSTEFGKAHILGLWLPEEIGPFEEMLKHFQEERLKRNLKMIDSLRKLGFDITYEEVEANAGGSTSVGRPHFASVLVQNGYAETSAEAFEKYLGENGTAFVAKFSPPPEEATRVLSSLGATVIIAHPLAQRKFQGQFPAEYPENLIRRLLPFGLDGLEVWHSAQSGEQSAKLLALAQKYDMAASGGSDYHGQKKKGVELGSGCGNLRVPASALENLLARRRAKGQPCQAFGQG